MLVLSFEVFLFDEIMFVFDFELVGEVFEIVCELVYEGMMMLLVIYEMGFVKEVVMWVCFVVEGCIYE